VLLVPAGNVGETILSGIAFPMANLLGQILPGEMKKAMTGHVVEVLTVAAQTITLPGGERVTFTPHSKFTLGDVTYSIDVHKKHLEQVKDLYKALLAIAQVTHANEYALRFSQQSLEMATAAVGRVASREDTPSDQFARVNEYAFNWLVSAREKYNVKDFGHIFKRYLEN
jgi:putative lipoic acid-binding regulatory protein